MENEKTYIVFGGTGGIGKGVARILRNSGANVVVIGRSEERLRGVIEELGVTGRVVDATDPGAVSEVVAELKASCGSIHGVVNCVGSLILKPIHLTSPQEWAETMNQNLGSAYAVTRAAVRSVVSPGGSIVLVSSAAARTGLANHEAIAAAKAGIIGLTLSAAATYASQGIRINCVAPGLTKTPLTQRIVSNPESEKFSRSMHALGTLGEPDDVASMIVYLLGDDARWVTGQVFGVDGGLATVRAKPSA
ncbi:MAG: 3-oxoacyl-[acyl-carrier-protein] reductase FabG [Pseudomonadota bacterium]|jgi:NAD(P)-dependent dehydrogenase (short-subunit alcohol dehydrogenase family)